MNVKPYSEVKQIAEDIGAAMRSMTVSDVQAFAREILLGRDLMREVRKGPRNWDAIDHALYTYEEGTK